MTWLFRRKEARQREYRLDRPVADCASCWKARAVALYWVSATCASCQKVHRARWLQPRPWMR